jgi:hypothetical protein
MSNYTPGPWAYLFEPDDDVFILHGREGETQIGALQAWSEGEGEANARLIAAAPEMYALLERLRSMATSTDCWDWQVWGDGDELLDEIEGTPHETK